MMRRALGDVTIEVPLDGWEHRLPTRREIRRARLARRQRERHKRLLWAGYYSTPLGFTEAWPPPDMIRTEASWIGYPKT